MALAPRHPTALAWMARWHVFHVVQGWAEDVPAAAQAALDVAARALDQDPDHALALATQGQVLAHLALRLDEADGSYDAALRSNPNSAPGRGLRGMLAAFTDRTKRGIEDTERALLLTPLDPHRFFFLALAAAAHFSNGTYLRGVTLAKESLRLNRSHTSTLRTLAVCQAGAGDIEAARRTAEKHMILQPEFRISAWQASTPSADFDMGRRVAKFMSKIGIPE